MPDDSPSMPDTVDGLHAEILRLREALLPFSQRAEYFDNKIKACGEAWQDENAYYDDPPGNDGIYLGQLRKAREVLSGNPSKETITYVESLRDKIDAMRQQYEHQVLVRGALEQKVARYQRALEHTGGWLLLRASQILNPELATLLKERAESIRKVLED